MRIMIAEDDAMVSNALEAALQHSGFEIDICSEDSALEHISRSLPPDIVICDWEVIYELGARICQELLRQKPSSQASTYIRQSRAQRRSEVA